MGAGRVFEAGARCVALTGVLALGVGFGGAERAAAQMDVLGAGAGFLSGGAVRISTTELDDWLGARAYPQFGRTAVSIGLGGYRILSSGVMLGAEAQGFNVGHAPHEQGEMGLGGGYATLGIGYALDVTSRVRVYPRVGIGAGGMALWIENEDTLDFEVVLQDQTAPPPREPNLARDGVVLDLGGGVELLPGGGGGPLIGVRAGYLTGPFTSTWEMYEHRVRGGPEASLAGPYVRVVLGWSWKR